MSNEENVPIVSHSPEEDKGGFAEAYDASVIENCTAECPYCQQICDLTKEHQGLHHCPDEHEWL